MNFEDYEKNYVSLYGDFALTVRNVLDSAIAAAGIPKPQSIQARSKSPARLRIRLEQAEKLDCQTIEQERRDLAGVRLIFYTNNDVDAFHQARVIWENFEMEPLAVKVHHPTLENQGTRYRGIHYTVRLKADRVGLPEYAKFAGLRCEVQIQTILNHAWSETTHDILYKPDQSPGFGARAMDRLEKRINDIMDKHLLPAGYEFQRVQHDYGRLMQGKSLFDRDAIKMLTNATDNNERFDLLTALKDDTLPNYDDIPAIYHDLYEPLIEVVRKVRQTAQVPISTTFGELPGHSADTVVRLIVEIFNFMRWVDVRATLSALMTIYREEPDPITRKLGGVDKMIDA